MCIFCAICDSWGWFIKYSIATLPTINCIVLMANGPKVVAVCTRVGQRSIVRASSLTCRAIAVHIYTYSSIFPYSNKRAHKSMLNPVPKSTENHEHRKANQVWQVHSKATTLLDLTTGSEFVVYASWIKVIYTRLTTHSLCFLHLCIQPLCAGASCKCGEKEELSQSEHLIQRHLTQPQEYRLLLYIVGPWFG